MGIFMDWEEFEKMHSKWEILQLGEDLEEGAGAMFAHVKEQELIVRHICVEGWDYIGQWSGVNLGKFLQRIGADTKAK